MGGQPSEGVVPTRPRRLVRGAIRVGEARPGVYALYRLITENVRVTTQFFDVH